MKYHVVLVMAAALLCFSLVSAQAPDIYNNCEIYGNCVPDVVSVVQNVSNSTVNDTTFCGGVLCSLLLRTDGGNSPIDDIDWGDFDIFNLRTLNVSKINTTTINATTTYTDEFLPVSGNRVFFREGGSVNNGASFTYSGNTFSLTYSDTSNVQVGLGLRDGLVSMSFNAFVNSKSISADGDSIRLLSTNLLGDSSQLTISNDNFTIDSPFFTDNEVIWTNGSAESSIRESNIFGPSTTWELDREGAGNGFLFIISGPDASLGWVGSQLQIISSTTEAPVFFFQNSDTTIVNGQDISLTQYKAGSPVANVVEIRVNASGAYGANANDRPGFYSIHVQSDGNSNDLLTPRFSINESGLIRHYAETQLDDDTHLLGDNIKLFFGASNDVSLLYNSTGFFNRLEVGSAPWFGNGFTSFNFGTVNVDNDGKVTIRDNDNFDGLAIKVQDGPRIFFDEGADGSETQVGFFGVLGNAAMEFSIRQFVGTGTDILFSLDSGGSRIAGGTKVLTVNHNGDLFITGDLNVTGDLYIDGDLFVGTIHIENGGNITGNGTCLLLSSPDGSTVNPICDE